MSASTGLMHSEYNHAPDQQTHFLQIWLLPKARGISPSYEQKYFEPAERRGRLRMVVSPSGHDGALSINADASIAVGLFGVDEALLDGEAQLRLSQGRGAEVLVFTLAGG